MVVFCAIDDPLVCIVKEVAGDRIVVDCGAGDALLHGQMPVGSIISLDLFDRENPNVVQYDCCAWLFQSNQFPIFIRPCHNHFVEETMLHAYATCDFALYIGLEKNREMDLGIFHKIAYIIHDEWIGEEGEKIWFIPFKKHYTGDKDGQR